jgi:hypothetical protein
MSIEVETRQVYVEKEPWWITTIKQLGLPTVLLILLGIGAYNGSVWLGENVIQPLTARQIQFINQVDESVQKITVIVEEHQKNNGKIANELEGISIGIKSLNEKSDKQNKTLETIEHQLKEGGSQ